MRRLHFLENTSYLGISWLFKKGGTLLTIYVSSFATQIECKIYVSKGETNFLGVNNGMEVPLFCEYGFWK
jgi:hypothetical protein